MTDTHLFSIRRPRETLGGLQNYSNIPQPASALKRSNSTSGAKESQLQGAHHGRSQSSSRMSLAPSRPPQPAFQRSSSGSNLADLGRTATLQRQSSSNMFSTTGRMSYAPGTAAAAAATPRAPPPGSTQAGGAGAGAPPTTLQRRSSIYSRPSAAAGPTLGGQGFFVQGPVPAGVPADRRRLRDRGVQTQLAAELEEYLTQGGFSMDMKHPLSATSLKSPTGKDFTYIFQWLYRRIDPAYQFQKAIDHEVPVLLKQLRYPYEKSITKSQLAAVGGQNWGVLLGMLHWLMQLAVMMERYAEDRYDYACAEEGLDVSGDRIIFRFLSGAYQTWLSSPPGDDDDDDEAANAILQPHVQAMAAEFEQGNQQYGDELAALEAEHAALQRQLAELAQGAPDLAKLEEHHGVFKSDVRKFEEYIATAGDKAKRHEARHDVLRKEIDETDKQLQEARAEQARLEAALGAQGLRVEDVEAMTAERAQLQAGLDDTGARRDDAAARAKQGESAAAAKLAELEALRDRFNADAYTAGLRGAAYDLQIRVHDNPSSSFSASQAGASRNGGGGGDRLLADADSGYRPDQLLSLDLQGGLKDELAALKREAVKQRSADRDADEENRRLLFDAKGAITDKEHEVEALEHRVRAAEEEFDKTKEGATTQRLQSDAQIEKLEKELRSMRTEVTTSVQSMEQKEMNINIEHEQLKDRADTLREELHTEIEKALNDIIKFKVHIQKSLEDYEGFVLEEVEQELGQEEEPLAPEKVEG